MCVCVCVCVYTHKDSSPVLVLQADAADDRDDADAANEHKRADAVDVTKVRTNAEDIDGRFSSTARRSRVPQLSGLGGGLVPKLSERQQEEEDEAQFVNQARSFLRRQGGARAGQGGEGAGGAGFVAEAENFLHLNAADAQSMQQSSPWLWEREGAAARENAELEAEEAPFLRQAHAVLDDKGERRFFV